jgi:hypothetical protein
MLRVCLFEIENEEGMGMGVEEGVRFSNPVETERDMIVVWVWCILFSCSVTLQQHLKFVVC